MLNKVMIIGHLGADPEVHTTSTGQKIANLRVATSERWHDKSTGEKRERTEWHRVAIFAEGLAGVAEKYLRKGSKVMLIGKLQTRKWQDRSGADRYSTEISLQGPKAELLMLDGRQGDGQNGQQNNTFGSQSYDQSGGNGFDDEIPF